MIVTNKLDTYFVLDSVLSALNVLTHLYHYPIR